MKALASGYVVKQKLPQFIMSLVGERTRKFPIFVKSSVTLNFP